MQLTKREVLAALAIAGSATAITLGGLARAQEEDVSTPAARHPVGIGEHPVAPLPFDPSKLKGLSERLLVSHHENNYAGAVKNLNKVEEQLAGVTKDTPGFIVAGLRERELTFTNSMILHELYFGNLGGDGKSGDAIQKAISDAFGTFTRFEELIRATAQSLSGGSGWTLLYLNFQTGDLRLHGSGNHTQALAFGAPLLVLDMYEHAYHMDYGAAAATYIDAFFANVKWDEVNRRYASAHKASQIVRGSNP